MTDGPTAVAIVADRLIDGTGRDPVEHAAVVWEGGTLVAAGPRATVRIPEGAEVVEGDDLTILPGLMDAHVHLAGLSGVDFGRLLMTPRALNLLNAVPNCAATLQAGFTTVRDAGLGPAALRMAVDAGMFPGPHLQMAVSVLSQTGGHGDGRMPCGCYLPFAQEGTEDVPDGVVDGIDAMRHKVREVLRAGADWIKLCTSGGVLSAGDDPDAAQFTVEEIATAVNEAATRRVRCMAHAMSARGIRNAVTAGVTSIEHGCLLDEEGAALMVERGAWLVPTLVAPEDVIAQAESGAQSVPAEMLDKARWIRTRHRDAMRLAVESGVRIALGTDSAVGPHGANGRELRLMVECGMAPMEALMAATSGCAELLGLSQRTGTVKPGLAADVVVVSGDPIADIGLFDHRESVRLVAKDGVVVRDTLTGSRALTGAGRPA